MPRKKDSCKFLGRKESNENLCESKIIQSRENPAIQGYSLRLSHGVLCSYPGRGGR